MSGMITTGTSSVSDYSNRTIAIEVTGICRQKVAKISNYIIKVPYNRMSQTIQSISRMGGKVAHVTLLPATSAASVAPSQSQTNNEPKAKKSKKN